MVESNRYTINNSALDKKPNWAISIKNGQIITQREILLYTLLAKKKPQKYSGRGMAF